MIIGYKDYIVTKWRPRLDEIAETIWNWGIGWD